MMNEHEPREPEQYAFYTDKEIKGMKEAWLAVGVGVGAVVTLAAIWAALKFGSEFILTY